MNCTTCNTNQVSQARIDYGLTTCIECATKDTRRKRAGIVHDEDGNCHTVFNIRSQREYVKPDVSKLSQQQRECLDIHNDIQKSHA